MTREFSTGRILTFQQKYRDTITVDAAGTLTKFWDVAEVDFFGELISKPSANVHRAVDKINVAFAQHREAIVIANKKLKNIWKKEKSQRHKIYLR